MEILFLHQKSVKDMNRALEDSECKLKQKMVQPPLSRYL